MTKFIVSAFSLVISISAQVGGGVVTREYTLPEGGDALVRDEMPNETSSDPFAGSEPLEGGEKFSAIEQQLREAGIMVGEGASVVYDRSSNSLTVRNTAEQHKMIEAYLESVANQGPKQLHIVMEFIEVEHLDFSDWLLSNRLKSDGTALRKQVQAWVKSGRGTIVESTVLRTNSGGVSKSESIHEYIYPTEFLPPNSADPAVIPDAFEARNVGVTLEVNPTLAPDNVTIDLNIASEIVELEGHSVWPNEEVDALFKCEMPTFYGMRVDTQITTVDGRYAFLGTTRPLEAKDKERRDPIILQFARVDIGKLRSWSVRTVE